MPQDYVVTLCALEVLELIADRLERRHHADSADIESLLQFFREITPATFRNQERAIVLLDELENYYKNSVFDGFVITARSYTRIIGDLILLAGFAETDEAVALRVRAAGPALHRLEGKYVSPHCI